jgi:hypothetical protein
MKYVHINPSPNRAHRRKLNAIARREPTTENIAANNAVLKLRANKPYRKPKEAA